MSGPRCRPDFLAPDFPAPIGPLRVREEALALPREERHILPRGVLTKVINEVSDAVVGLGPIEFLLKDPEVTEVVAYGHILYTQAWVDRVRAAGKACPLAPADRAGVVSRHAHLSNLWEGEPGRLHVLPGVRCDAGRSGTRSRAAEDRHGGVL